MGLSNAKWRKSSWSGPDGGECVEVSTNLPGVVALRDSKQTDGPVILLSRRDWTAFITTIKDGESID